MALLALLFPVVLLALGWYAHDIPILKSMSAYYFAPDPTETDMREFPMRIWFVGILWTLGCFLILYKGFTHGENRLLNIAGLSALGVALVPITPPRQCTDCGFGWTFGHTALALLAFVCAAVAAWAFSHKTLNELEDPQDQVRFQRHYSLLAGAMVLFPLLAIAASFVYEWYTLIFEIIGLLAFGTFWLVKTREIAKSNFEFKAMNNRLRAPRAMTAEEQGSLRMKVARALDWEPITHEIARRMRGGSP
jgi:uncharacterized membrane protein